MNWKRSLIAAACAVPLILLLAWGFTRDPAEIQSPLPGREAPRFALPVFAPGEPPLNRPIGDSVRSADLRGQIVVLNFWASWCGPCRAEHVALSAGARRYAAKPVRFLGVLYNDSVSTASAWIAEMGGQSYPSLLDRQTRTAIDYGVYGVPETYFIDATGRVVDKLVGPMTESVLNRVLDSLLATPVTATKRGP